MTGKRKLTDDELLDVIAEQAIDDEAERIAHMSDAELDAELAAAGVDPVKAHAKAEAMAARLAGAQKPPATVKRFPASRRVAVLLAAAALLALAFVALLYLPRGRERAPLPIGPEPSIARPAPSVSEKLVQPAVDASPWDAADAGPLKPPMRR
jgi:hypothetical protein